jgi:hypothetical protein
VFESICDAALFSLIEHEAEPKTKTKNIISVFSCSTILIFLIVSEKMPDYVRFYQINLIKSDIVWHFFTGKGHSQERIFLFGYLDYSKQKICVTLFSLTSGTI